MIRNHIEEANDQSAFLIGMASMLQVMHQPENAKIVYDAAKNLQKLARHMCGQGYICAGGPNCESDHK